MIDLSTLNDNQLKAVNWGEGPLLVLAGPGSGKTWVLACRIASLIEKTPTKHFKILGLTFTNKAAAEMRERITRLIPDAGERAVLRTFHSFSADLLRQHGHHVGLKPDFTILGRDADRYSLLDEAIDRAQNNLATRGPMREKLLHLVSRLTENNVAADSALEVLQRCSFDDPQMLASVYRNYRELMVERNILDFPGLIAETLSMLEKKPAVRKHVQKIYTHICVDEFQDTNLSQYRILCNLVDPTTKNLFVVADDDQIIYQWNGASPERLWKLREDFDMELLQLPENYRCPAEVVELANNLIKHNFDDRSPERMALKANKKKGIGEKAIRCQKLDNFEQEIEEVVRDIVRRPASERTGCVILARTKKLLEKASGELEKAKIPVCLARRKNEFESAPLQWLHSILRLTNSRSSREYLRLACSAFFSLEGINLDVEDIMSRAAAAGDGDYLRSFARTALDCEELSPCARNLIDNSFSRLSERLDFWSFQKDAFVWFDCLPDTAPPGESTFNDYSEEKKTWNNLTNRITYERGGKQEVTLHMFLQGLDLQSKSPVPPQNAVSCFTIHASKGMEFDHVYLVGMVEEQLPNWFAVRKGDNSREMREERRNCFVAITRAQKTLSLSYSSQVHGRERKPSRFLYEMGVLHSAGMGEQGNLSDQAVCLEI